MLVQHVSMGSYRNGINYRPKTNHQPVVQSQPSFHGKKGALIGGLVGAIGTAVGVAATGGLALIPAIAGYIATIGGMGAVAGHMAEDDIKKTFKE